MPKYRVWISTPSFRSLPWLPCAVASVADQARDDIEVHHHVQDGGSDDGTREWLEAYAEQCTREPRPGYTFSFESAPDRGMYEAINKGWSKAPESFDFLGHLNCDEQYLSGAIQTVVEGFTKNPAWEVLLAGMIVIDTKGHYICHRHSLNPSALVFRFTCGGMTAATFQRASVYQKRGICFEIGWRMIADKIWYLRLITSGVVIGHLNRLVSTFMETGANLGWSPAALDEQQRYADRYLGGKIYGIYIFEKWNALRRLVKDWHVAPPTSYDLYTPKDLLQRRSFFIKNPTFHWGKHLKSSSPGAFSIIKKAIRRLFPATHLATAQDALSLATPKKAKNPLRILITEGHTDANIGSGALVENSLTLLRERFPEAQIRVIAIYPQAFKERYQVESEFDLFEYPYKKTIFYKIRWAFKTLFWMAVIRLQTRKGFKKIRFFSQKIRHYLWADWVVSVHAERIKESFHIDALYTLFSFHIAHLLGKKVILFPCTLGPYGFGTRSLVNRWLRDVDLIFTRDKLSFKLAHEADGLTPEKIIACPDVAIIQKSIGRQEALALIGCSPEDKLVGISVMRWRYIQGNVSAYSNYASYVVEMAKVVDHLISTYGVKVVLYPTNYAIHGCTTEDREAVCDIYTAASLKERVIKMERFLAPSELKGALACSEVNITTRMHACIFSTSAGVPTLSVNYLYKLREYMAALGLQDYSIDIEYFNAAWMKTVFAKIWSLRPEIRQQLQDRIEAKRALLNANIDLLHNLV